MGRLQQVILTAIVYILYLVLGTLIFETLEKGGKRRF